MSSASLHTRSGWRRPVAAAAFGLCALAAATPAAAAGNELDALVGKVVAAYGGEAALAKVTGYRMEGVQTSSMRGTGPFVRLFQRPGRLRVDFDYPGHPESRILDGAQGWRSDGKGKMAPSEGFLLGSMVLQAARADLPWILTERRAGAKLLAPGSDGTVRGIEIPLGPGLVMTAFVDLATGRVVRSSGTIDTPEMKTGFTTEFADFRSVDGVLFPFRESSGAAGQSTGSTDVARIVVNPRLTDKDFRP